MTREEAIRKVKGYLTDYLVEDEYNEVEEIVNALKQEASDDCVSRKALLDMATTIRTDDCSGNEIIEVVDIDDIKALPPVTPAQRWISVSKRLPTKEEYIASNGLFIVSDGNRVYTAHFDIYESISFGRPTMNGFKVDKCVAAWMPLPTLYEMPLQKSYEEEHEDL